MRSWKRTTKQLWFLSHRTQAHPMHVVCCAMDAMMLQDRALMLTLWPLCGYGSLRCCYTRVSYSSRAEWMASGERCEIRSEKDCVSKRRACVGVCFDTFQMLLSEILFQWKYDAHILWVSRMQLRKRLCTKHCKKKKRLHFPEVQSIMITFLWLTSSYWHILAACKVVCTLYRGELQ